MFFIKSMFWRLNRKTVRNASLGGSKLSKIRAKIDGKWKLKASNFLMSIFDHFGVDFGSILGSKNQEKAILGSSGRRLGSILRFVFDF